jgi:hypothetical protein
MGWDATRTADRADHLERAARAPDPAAPRARRRLSTCSAAASVSLSGSSVVEKNLDRMTLFVAAIWIIAIIGTGLLVKAGV